MEQVQSAGRSSPTSRQHAYDRSRRFRDEAPAQPPFYPQDSLADGHHRVRNDDFLGSRPHTQDDSAFNADDGDPTEPFPNKSFVFTLFRMLQDNSLRDLIHWNREGNALVIPDIEAFKTNALGRYFNGSYDNFVRKLNGYSFEKIGRSKTTATYKHKENKFLRDFPQLLRDIKRKGQQPENPLHQSQPTSSLCAMSNTHSLSQPTVQPDPERDVLDLQRENASLKTKLQEREEAYKNLESTNMFLMGLLSQMGAGNEDLMRRLSLRPLALPGANGHTYAIPPPTTVHLPNVPRANYPESVSNIAPMHVPPIHIAGGNGIAPFGNQSTLGGPRLKSDGLPLHPHPATPATTLSPQLLRPNVGQSSMSMTDGLPADRGGCVQPSPLIVDDTGPRWQTSSSGFYQHMIADACAFPIASNHHNPSNGLAGPSRGSPHHRNLPMAVVPRRQPEDATAQSGQSAISSYLFQTSSFPYFN